MIHLPHNFIAVAYKSGYFGSFINLLLQLSPEVVSTVIPSKLQDTDNFTFNDGTAHAYKSNWFKDLHKYTDTVTEDTWSNKLTPKYKDLDLKSTDTITFRCHPNLAYSMNFIDPFKIIYVGHSTPYYGDRAYFEKMIKPNMDGFLRDAFYQIFKSKPDQLPSNKMSPRLMRELLSRHINHQVKSIQEIQEQFEKNVFYLDAKCILNKDYPLYKSMCLWANLTTISEDTFYTIIDNYRSKSWTVR